MAKPKNIASSPDVDLGQATGALLEPSGALLVPSGIEVGSHEGEPWLLADVRQRVAHKRLPTSRQRQLLQHADVLAVDSSESAIIRFAQQYGFLGKPQHASVGVWGEPLSVWRTELRLYAALRSLQDALDRADRDAAPLTRIVHWDQATVSIGVPTAEGDVDLLTLWQDDPRDKRLLDGWRRGDLISPARYALLRRVNDQLAAHVNLLVVERPRSQGRDGISMALRYAPVTLLGAIYLHLALQLAGATDREGECQWCHGPMPLRGNVKRFCQDRCRAAANYTPRPRRSSATTSTEDS